MGPLQGTNLGRAGTCEIATWMELFALSIRKPGTPSGKSNSLGDTRMTMKVYHVVPKVPDVVATTAAKVLHAVGGTLCVILIYYVEEREAAMMAEPCLHWLQWRLSSRCRSRLRHRRQRRGL